MQWGAQPSTPAAVDAAITAAIAGTLLKSDNLASVANVNTARSNLGAARKPFRCMRADYWTWLTHAPSTGSVANQTGVEDGRVVWMPATFEHDLSLKALAVEVSTAGTPVASTASFALYSVAADGTPGNLLEDWTAKGTINLAGGTGTPSMVFAASPIAAGHYYLALRLTLAGGGAPSLRSCQGPHYGVGAASLTTALSILGGYRSSATGLASFPPSATIDNTTGRHGVMIWAQNA